MHRLNTPRFSLTTSLRFLLSTAPFADIAAHLQTKRDKYNALHLTPASSLLPATFEQYIPQLLKENDNGVTTSIWIHLSPQVLHHVSFLVNAHSFKIHHGKDNQISLYRWLLPNREDLVVPYSMFHVGCGGVFIKDDHLFLIRQKAGELKGRYGVPGGRANFGEGLKKCVEREIFEEVGIKSQFRRLLWIRELSNYTYGAFDMYYACLLHAEPSEFDNLKMCDHEIDKTEWVHLSKLRDFSKQHSFGTQLELSNYICDLYEKGFDFANLKENYKERIYQSPLDKTNRFFGHHRLLDTL